jgi:hypothetical protein
MPLVALILRAVGVLLGMTFIGLGVPLFFMPIPLGLIFIALGVLVLIVSSARAARLVRRFRARNPDFDARLRRIELAMPRLLARILAGTRPTP